MNLSVRFSLIIGMIASGAWAAGRSADEVEIDNRTYQTLYLSRLGDPTTQTIVPKRRLGTYIVPLTGSQEMLQITGFAGVNGPVAETSFNGFNGNLAQVCSLVINGSDDIRIRYSATAAANTSGTNGTRSSVIATDTSSSAYRGSGGYPGQASSTGRSTGSQQEKSGKTRDSDAPEYPSPKPETPKKSEPKLLASGAAGIRVRVARPDALVTPPEPPAPLANTAFKAKPVVSQAKTGTTSAPKRNRSLVSWSGVALVLLAFVVYRRVSRQSTRRRHR